MHKINIKKSHSFQIIKLFWQMWAVFLLVTLKPTLVSSFIQAAVSIFRSASENITQEDQNVYNYIKAY